MGIWVKAMDKCTIQINGVRNIAKYRKSGASVVVKFGKGRG